MREAAAPQRIFDALLRLHLNRPGVIRIVGPEGTVAGLHSRLHGYLWNLLGEHSPDFALHVADFANGALGPWTAFRARAAYLGLRGKAGAAPPAT